MQEKWENLNFRSVSRMAWSGRQSLGAARRALRPPRCAVWPGKATWQRPERGNARAVITLTKWGIACLAFAGSWLQASLRHIELLLYCAGPAARYCLSAVLTCPNIGTRARSGSYSAVVSCGIMISNADACMSTSHSVETICMSKQVNKALHNIMKCVREKYILYHLLYYKQSFFMEEMLTWFWENI